jgi:hypothetical protein
MRGGFKSGAGALLTADRPHKGAGALFTAATRI